jgi:hypothetical protein
VELSGGALRGKGYGKRNPYQGIIVLFMAEVTLGKTLGNWYHFIK